MKTAIRWTVGCLMLLGAASAVNAQTTDTVTKVPFAFNVGATALPQDTYTISRIHGQNGAFMLRGERHGVVILTQPDAVTDPDATPSLIFNRYGDRYFLREARLPGSVALRLPRSSAEVDAAERAPQHSVSEVVVPALAK